MINYNRLGYEIKRDLANFSEKISNGLKRPQSKFLLQMIYGILAGNKLHLSKIARSLNENITLKKTIDRLSRSNWHWLNALLDWVSSDSGLKNGETQITGSPPAKTALNIA